LGQFIKGQDLTSVFKDPCSGSACELQSTDSKSFGELEQSDIISDSANNSNNPGIELIRSGFFGGILRFTLSFVFYKAIFGEDSDNSGDRDRIAIES
jgi:hypothetical protein